MNINPNEMQWTRRPKQYKITENGVEIITEPFTDLWQRTYYHFRNDNAPLLQLISDEKFFSFCVKTAFDTKVRYDQCGIVMYLDSDNWLKASAEYENDKIQRLGSVVTNNGYSDWSSVDIDASKKEMWFRLSRRGDDFCIENSFDGISYHQMRICHMFAAKDELAFGIYACSSEDSSFKATFSDMEISECKWLAHDGQAPDAE
jgi:regulation of enolase protein 1 (concanavalin A-like superfamily)